MDTVPCKSLGSSGKWSGVLETIQAVEVTNRAQLPFKEMSSRQYDCKRVFRLGDRSKHCGSGHVTLDKASHLSES